MDVSWLCTFSSLIGTFNIQLSCIQKIWDCHVIAFESEKCSPSFSSSNLILPLLLSLPRRACFCFHLLSLLLFHQPLLLTQCQF
uniref:Uncharacterized protein n=1 Tax=Arundo donax TaxID=35708 RepID=A0A0A9AVT1_ARUDO